MEPEYAELVKLYQGGREAYLEFSRKVHDRWRDGGPTLEEYKRGDPILSFEQYVMLSLVRAAALETRLEAADTERDRLWCVALIAAGLDPREIAKVTGEFNRLRAPAALAGEEKPSAEQLVGKQWLAMRSVDPDDPTPAIAEED